MLLANPSAGYAARGASEHPLSLGLLLLDRTEAQKYNKDGKGHGRKQARQILNKVIAGGLAVEFNSDGTSVYMDTGDGASEHIGVWSDWKTYIANQSHDIVGNAGIARLTCEFIESTTDPNRGGARRCDFVAYCGDGGFWRLHPGGRSGDAAPRHFDPKDLASQVLESTEPVEWSATQMWKDQKPQTYGTEMCNSTPQVDRVGKKEVWQWVESLGALEHACHEFDIGGDADFKWWLWLPTLADAGHISVATPIEKCRIRTDGWSSAHFIFSATDGEMQEICLRRSGAITRLQGGA